MPAVGDNGTVSPPKWPWGLWLILAGTAIFHGFPLAAYTVARAAGSLPDPAQIHGPWCSCRYEAGC